MSGVNMAMLQKSKATDWKFDSWYTVEVQSKLKLVHRLIYMPMCS